MTVKQCQLRRKMPEIKKKKKVQWQGAEGFKEVKQIIRGVKKKNRLELCKHKMGRLAWYTFTKSM